MFVMRPPSPLPLEQYWRDFTPDLEAAPREPVYAVGLVSPKGVPFVLVREELGTDRVGHMIAWFLWRGRACVGFLGASLLDNPFVGGQPIGSADALNVRHSVDIWRSHVADGRGVGQIAEQFSRMASRGLGLGYATYLEIIRQLSHHGWALRSYPTLRSPEAKAVWDRLGRAPGVNLVRPAHNWDMREFAIMFAGSPALRPPGPIVTHQ